MNFTETVRTVDGETHEDDVGVRVGERTETIVIFLSCRVPQRQLHLHAHKTSFTYRRAGIKKFDLEGSCAVHKKLDRL